MTDPDNSPDSSEETNLTPNPDRWILLMDVLAFQFKLLLDGVRDVILSPVSITAALYGVIVSGSNPGKYFYRVLKFGHKTDRWINLFGAYSQRTLKDSQDSQQSTDVYVHRIESLIINEYHKGGVIKDIKSRTDDLFDRLSHDVSSSNRQSSMEEIPGENKPGMDNTDKIQIGDENTGNKKPKE